MKIIFFRIALLLLTFSLTGCGQAGSTNANKKQSAYERVIETQELKVGYVPYPPGLIKDPNTGELSGIFYDTLESIGKSMGIKVRWVEEVTWGTMIEGLKSNRYDVIGSPVWANSTRGKVADFTNPLYLSGIGAYVRKSDSRFEEGLTRINDKSVKVSTIDGEMSKIIADSDFPLAAQVALPQLSDVSQMLLEVETSKADVTFVEPYLANIYIKGNDSDLVNIAEKNPIRIFANSYMINKSENDLKSMLNIAIDEQINSGNVERLLVKYTGTTSSFYLPAKPYLIR